MPRPFMEHPSGAFQTAVDAMADAIKRLRSLPEWNDWITFRAQGMGSRVDNYRMANIRMRKDELELDTSVDLEVVTRLAGVPRSCLSEHGARYSVASATPDQVARILDAIFRYHLGIRPHTGEGEDYAIGAEWCSGITRRRT
jgi:hypothetical protein